MLKERMAVVTDVAIALHEAEIAIDAAIARTNALAAMLPASGAGLKLSPTVTQPAFDDVAAVLAALNASRSGAVKLHGTLDRLKGLAGLKNMVVAIGDLWKIATPPKGMKGGNDDHIADIRTVA